MYPWAEIVDPWERAFRSDEIEALYASALGRIISPGSSLDEIRAAQAELELLYRLHNLPRMAAHRRSGQRTAPAAVLDRQKWLRWLLGILKRREVHA